ncbi:MAG: hypothetical protein ACK56F_14955 [bacterium]
MVARSSPLTAATSPRSPSAARFSINLRKRMSSTVVASKPSGVRLSRNLPIFEAKNSEELVILRTIIGVKMRIGRLELTRH